MSESLPLRFRNYMKLFAECAFLFLPLYGLANWFAEKNGQPLHLYFEWEKQIPFVPASILAYLSIFLLLVAPIFFLETERMASMGVAIKRSTLVAGLCFFFLPAETAWTRPTEFGPFRSLFEVLYAIDRPHNLMPSLHVAFATIAVFALSRRANALANIFLFSWLMLIAISVLTTWQHQVVDVVTGFTLGYVTTRSRRRPPITSRY